jgi:hypothetical protein
MKNRDRKMLGAVVSSLLLTAWPPQVGADQKCVDHDKEGKCLRVQQCPELNNNLANSIFEKLPKEDSSSEPRTIQKLASMHNAKEEEIAKAIKLLQDRDYLVAKDGGYLGRRDCRS